ncbi:hypothetical protein GGR57DRAFT_505364 [Xylariaceae sp. FL1272]|nr:hypothetical protein GGR57DRAFT_505364 [Xylariaceae sp. FL1272]
MEFAQDYPMVGQPGVDYQQRRAPQASGFRPSINPALLSVPPPPADFNHQPAPWFRAPPAFETRPGTQQFHTYHQNVQTDLMHSNDYSPYPYDHHRSGLVPQAAAHQATPFGQFNGQPHHAAPIHDAFHHASRHAATHAPMLPYGHAGTPNNARIQQGASPHSINVEQNHLYPSPSGTRSASQGHIDEQPQKSGEQGITEEDWAAILEANFYPVPQHDTPEEQHPQLPIVGEDDWNIRLGPISDNLAEQSASARQSQPPLEEALPQEVHPQVHTAPPPVPHPTQPAPKSKKRKTASATPENQSPEKKPRKVRTRSCDCCRKAKTQCDFPEGSVVCTRCMRKGCSCSGPATVDKRTNDTTETRLKNFLFELKKSINNTASLIYRILIYEAGMIELCKAHPNNEYIQEVGPINFPEPPQLAAYEGHHVKLSEKRAAYQEAINTGRIIWTLLASWRKHILEGDPLEYLAEGSPLHVACSDWGNHGVRVPEGGLSDENPIWNDFDNYFRDFLPTSGGSD